MKVLGLIQASNEVCCRYRIEAFRNALAYHNLDLEIIALRKNILGRLGDLRKAKQADVVILQRKLLPLWELSLLRNWSKRLIFDVDDAIYQRDSNSRKRSASRRRLARFRTIVREADAVFVGNDFLRLVASKWTPPEQVMLMPTCVDLAKYQPARHFRKLLDARLVWIGQSSTLETLGVAGGQLGAIAQRLPDLEFRQICSRSAAFSALKVVFRPWSLATETAELAEGDIGIAYMPDDSWSMGKCGLKVLQYMAAGLPVVANPVGVHREMIVHGETGFLADTPGEWAEAVFRLASQPELRVKLGAAGRKIVEQRYSTNVWAPQFADCVRRIAQGISPQLRKAG
jgi:glycosyltransferase involved in cell wall biosynthesis